MCKLCCGLPRPASNKPRRHGVKHIVYLNADELALIRRKPRASGCPECKDKKVKKVRGQVHYLVSISTPQLDKVKVFSGRRKGIKTGARRAFNPTVRRVLQQNYKAFLRSGMPARVGNPGLTIARGEAKGRVKAFAKGEARSKWDEHQGIPQARAAREHFQRMQHEDATRRRYAAARGPGQGMSFPFFN